MDVRFAVGLFVVIAIGVTVVGNVLAGRHHRVAVMAMVGCVLGAVLLVGGIPLAAGSGSTGALLLDTINNALRPVGPDVGDRGTWLGDGWGQDSTARKLWIWVVFSVLTFVPVLINAVRARDQRWLELLAMVIYAACSVALAVTLIFAYKGAAWAYPIYTAAALLLWVLAIVWLGLIGLFALQRFHRMRDAY